MTRLGVCMLASMSALLPAGILSRATLLAGGGGGLHHDTLSRTWSIVAPILPVS